MKWIKEKKVQSYFFKNISKIDKALSRLINKKGKECELTKSWMKEDFSSIDPRGIRRIGKDIGKEIEFIKNLPTKKIWSQNGFAGEFY